MIRRLPILALVLTVAAAAADPRLIGIEGEAEATLSRGDYQAKPLDDRTPLILSIEGVAKSAAGRFSYDFHFIGFEPGTYKLSDYLVHPDGSPAAELAETFVSVRSVLPPDHNGALNGYVPRPFPWFGGYRFLLGCLAGLWVLGLAAFAWFGRKRKTVVVEEVAAPPPTFAERMRPFVDSAAAGTLDTAGQAELERLMTGYWRDKLALPDLRMADALAALKAHPQAGELLRALERWLHRPGGVPEEEIHGLLEPYRHVPAASGKEVCA